jgi:peptide/nickel transport system substrate-binding protein
MVVVLFAYSNAIGDSPGGEIVMAQTVFPKTLDPHMETGGPSSLSIDWLFYEGLMELELDGTLKPCLATSWEISDDQLEISFKLRNDVTFHDGTKFNANAVKFNFDRVLDPDNKLSARYQLLSIKEVQVLDDLSVKVVLKEKDAVLIYAIASRPGAMMVSPAAVKKYGQDFRLNPVGTGPFVFEEWISMDRVVAGKNPNYWRKAENGDALPYLDKVTARIVPETTVKLAELKRGTIHIIDNISAKDAAAARANPDIVVVEPGNTWFRHITFNNKKPPLSDPYFRKAISYAIDSEMILKATAFGEGYLTGFMANKKWPGYDPSFTPYSYDLDKAKEMLAKSGYAGKKVNLKFSFYNNDPERSVGELIQAQLSQLGINVTLDFIQVSAWIQLMRSGKSDLGISRHETPMPHPWMPLSDRLFPWEGGGRNWAWYENPKVTDLLDQLKKTIDPQQQGKLIREIEQIVVDDAGYYSLYQQTISRGVRKELKDFIITRQGGFKLHKAKLAK